MSTGLYCCNCERELEHNEDVTIIAGAYIEYELGEYVTMPTNEPNFSTLCKDCSDKVLHLKPNRASEQSVGLICDHAGMCNMPRCPHQVSHTTIGDCETQGECPDIGDELVMCVEVVKPNRVVVEVEGGMVTGVRAVQPSEVVVIIYASTDTLEFPYGPKTYGGPNGLPVKQLNAVKEEP